MLNNQAVFEIAREITGRQDILFINHSPNIFLPESASQI
jgi:hypothetical protein